MNWWQKLREDSLVARLAAPTDRPVLADLLSRAWRRHGVLAVEEQATLLNSGVSTLAFTRNEAIGFLGLRVRERAGDDRELWVDAAMVTIASGTQPAKTLSVLLEAAMPALREQGATGMVCLTGEGWLHEALRETSFRKIDQVITYVRSNRISLPVASNVAVLRPAGPAEAGMVLDLNSAAFAALWRYDSATTLSWLLTAEHAMLAERNGRPVGFALTSHASNNGYDQLIRLATHPDAQGQGVGRQLVVDAIAYSQQAGSPGLALNTQVSNAASRHLYEALDFRITGGAINVMAHRVR